MNWDDPEARGKLIQQVGIEEYRRMFARHRAQSVICTVAGHEIRPVATRFGRLFHVGNTKIAFPTMPEARRYAEANPVQPNEG